MGLIRSFLNGGLVNWVSTFFLLTVFRIHSLITWDFLLVNTYAEASEIIITGIPRFFIQAFRQGGGVFTLLPPLTGIIFLLFGAFFAGVISKTKGEATLSFFFFLVILIFTLLFTLNIFSGLFLGSFTPSDFLIPSLSVQPLHVMLDFFFGLPFAIFGQTLIKREE